MVLESQDETSGRNNLWFTLVLPWIARNVAPEETMLFGVTYALLETEDAARDAAEAGGRIDRINPLLIGVPWDGEAPKDAPRTADAGTRVRGVRT